MDYVMKYHMFYINYVKHNMTWKLQNMVGIESLMHSAKT